MSKLKLRMPKICLPEINEAVKNVNRDHKKGSLKLLSKKALDQKPFEYELIFEAKNTHILFRFGQYYSQAIHEAYEGKN